VLPGIIAFALFPEQVVKPDYAYPTLVLNLLPVGLVGLVMAALLAAVMGAMSSVFNSASTLVTLDFYKKIRPEASERQLVMFGRIATGGMVLLGLLWVPFIHKLSAELYIYLQSVQAYISPPIAVCFIFGILWTRVNGQGAISSLLAGFVLGATRFIFEVLDKSRHYDPAHSLAGGHEFSALCHFYVLSLRGSAGRRKLHVSGARPEKAGWADLRDGR
jgi:SSS family solute:Na+ symporter